PGRRLRLWRRGWRWNHTELYQHAEPVRVGVMQNNLAVDDPVHHQQAERKLLIRRRHAHERSGVRSASPRSRRYGVSLGNLVLDGGLSIRKGGADHWLTDDGLIQPGMIFH